MADTKISALPASTTPLAGTEVLPIVQGGVTKQVSVANLTAGRPISATELTLTTGNLIVANGQGIDFSATPGTGTSELLSDYEEGTWTPTFTNLTVVGTPTYTGKYTKVGRLVTFTLRIQSTTSTTSAAGGTFFNQPFVQFSNRGTITAADGNATASYGVGLIADDGNCYLPTWSAVADVIVSGFYYV
jgi:hypothetical protein